MWEFLESKTAWLGCFFIVASLWAVDSILSAVRLALAYCMSKPGEENKVLEQEEMALRQTTMDKRQTMM